MKFYNDFLGQDDANSTFEFYGGDDKEVFLENLHKQPPDWYYRDTKITYKYNNHGHRCKDLKEINFSNYLLFTGCSHTQGIGLELEKTFPYMLSQELGMDYYNLALSASGVDVLHYNLMIWFAKYKLKPRAIFVQWPDHSRFISSHDNFTNVVPMGSWTQDPKAKKFVVDSEISGMFQTRKLLYHNQIHHVAGVPVISLQFSGLHTYNDTSLYLKRKDFARDRVHSGIESNKEFVKLILSNLKTLNI
jgi:hypothetical protein